MRKECLDYGLASSDIRTLFEYGKERKEEVGEGNVCDFSIGNPSVEPPSIVNETLVGLLSNNPSALLHGYTSGAGDITVRNAISDYLNKTYNAKTKGSLIYMTCGAAASLSIAVNALLQNGDEVILFAPYFPEYRVFVEYAGCSVTLVKPNIQTFEPDLRDFSNSISSKTRMVIINSPNNPSGVIYRKETLEAISRILEEKQKEYGHPIYILSDDPYRELTYIDSPHNLITNIYQNSLIAYSFSKSLSLPGERIGYLLVNPKCEEASKVFAAICGAGRALGYVCAPALFQKMIPSCLGFTGDINIYRRNRDFLYNSLAGLGYEMVYPSGAFYLFVKALEEDARAFSNKAKEFDLLLVPSDSFGVSGYVRVAYCVSFETIVASLPAWKLLKESYGG